MGLEAIRGRYYFISGGTGANIFQLPGSAGIAAIDNEMEVFRNLVEGGQQGKIKPVFQLFRFAPGTELVFESGRESSFASLSKSFFIVSNVTHGLALVFIAEQSAVHAAHSLRRFVQSRCFPEDLSRALIAAEELLEHGGIG